MDRLEWLDGEQALAELLPQWRRLADEHWSPFMQLEWLLPWVEAFGGSGQLRTAVLWRDGRLAAALPLIVEGRRATAPTNKHTPVFEPLGADAAAVRAVIGHALEGYPTLTIWGLPLDEGRSAESDVRAAAGRGAVLVVPWLHPPVVDLVGPAADARERPGVGRSGSKELGKNLRRLGRAHDVRFDLVASPSDPKAALEELIGLEGSGWKGRDGTSIDSSLDTVTFFTRMGEAFAERGWLRMPRLSADGKPIAMQLTLLYRRRLWTLKSGYDERFGAFSPGHLLDQAVMEECVAQRLDAVELLGNSDGTKAQYATSGRVVGIVRITPRSPTGVIRHLYHGELRPRAKAIYLRSGGLGVRAKVQRTIVRLRRGG